MFSLQIFAAVSSSVVDAAVTVRTTPFSSSAPHLYWTGSGDNNSVAACNRTCAAACLDTHTSGSKWGDMEAQIVDGCRAGCGCPPGADHVLAVTSSGSARISMDAGDTWSDISEKLMVNVTRGIPYRITSAHVSNVDSSNITLLTNTTLVFASSDGGTNWRPVRVAQFPEADQSVIGWQWHPSKQNLALASTPEGRIYHTQDGGATWTMMLQNAAQCHWASLPSGNPDRIIAVIASSTPGKFEVIATENFMRTREVLLGKGAPAGVPELASRVWVHFSFVVAAVPQLGAADVTTSDSVQLWFRSDTGNKTFRESSTAHVNAVTGDAAQETKHRALRFHAAFWPVNVQLPRAWQVQQMEVLHSSEHSLIFFLPADGFSLPWGHVFRFDVRSARVELLLSDVHKPNDFSKPEWRMVGGIDGAFVANRVVMDRGQDLDAAERVLDAQALDFMSSESSIEEDSDAEAVVDESDSSIAQRFRVGKSRAQMVVRSYISMDYGVMWQSLLSAGSASDVASADGSSTSAQLHLSSWVSSAFAPGILVGVGNVGMRLSDNRGHHNVFVSRDAGLSWVKVLDGAHHVTLLSHGDILMAAPVLNPSLVRFSVNSGKIWQDLVVQPAVEPDLLFAGVFTHASHTTLRAFVALGSDSRRDIQLAALNFAAALPTDCHVPQLLSPMGDLGSDFERWSPADGKGNIREHQQCHLGAKTEYWRRLPDRPCKTGHANLPLPSASPLTAMVCECSVSDWACAPGFFRATYHPDALCEPLPGFVQDNVTTLCDASGADRVYPTRGYVKAPGNLCNGGLDLAPRRETCFENLGVVAEVRRAYYRNRFSMCALIIVLSGIMLALLSQSKPLFPLFDLCGRSRFAKKGWRESKHVDEKTWLIKGKFDLPY